jgi:hypothetical protein
MKRTIMVLTLLGGIACLAFSFEAGGGISVFVPESLYLHEAGSLSVETNFQYALGLSKFLSIPIGISYNKIYGYLPGGTAALDAVTRPWFFGDSIMGFAAVKIRLPVSIFHLDLLGGGAANWNVTLTPVGGAIESYLASDANADAAALTKLSAEAPWGYGWVAGAALGVSIKKITVDISGTYRDVRSPLKLTADYSAISGTGTAVQTSTTLDTAAALVMRGISIGLTGQFSF